MSSLLIGSLSLCFEIVFSSAFTLWSWSRMMVQPQPPSLSALTLRNCAQSDLEDEVEDEEGEEEAGEVAEGQEDDEPLSHDDHRHRHAAAPRGHSEVTRGHRGHSRGWRTDGHNMTDCLQGKI